ncbi:FAD binding domain-containing protein, partial [Rhodopseudomonas sp. WA056]|uniref:FAD binding domain-containing protein n=1 Tax=Rhodopseudomonas sp. WA056 TaxID=2269367 RepID=UPI001FEE8B7E
MNLLRPGSIDEAIAALLAHPGGRLLGGGTDLLVNMRRGIAQPEMLIDTTGIAEIKRPVVDGSGVAIRAGVT